MHRNSVKPTAPARYIRVLRRVRQAFRLGSAGEDGQALVELALVLPLLLLLVFGITLFGLVVNSANNQTHVANEIARYAVVDEDPICPKGSVCAGSPTTGLAAWGKGQIDKVLSNETVCITFPTNEATKTSGQQGDPVEVVVKGTVKWFPIFEYHHFPTTTVEGKAVMRLEHAPSVYGKECA